MELLAHILVTLVIALVLYILFSIRLSRALAKAPRNEIVKELRENIESAVEFINVSVDLMDRKNRAFYNMLRRAEELTRRLEKETVRGANNPEEAVSKESVAGAAVAGAAVPKAAVPKAKFSGGRASRGASREEYAPGGVEELDGLAAVPEAFQGPRQAVSSPSGGMSSGVGGKPETRTPPSGLSREEEAGLARVLRELGEDRADLSHAGDSASEAYEAGRLSSGGAFPAPENSPGLEGGGALGGFLANTGRLVRRLLGIQSGDKSASLEGVPGAGEPSPSGGGASNFARLLDSAQESRPEAARRAPERIEDILTLSGDSPPVHESPSVHDSPSFHGSPPVHKEEPISNSALDALDERDTVRSLLEENGLEPPFASGEKRREAIRLLVMYGFSMDEISREIGVDPAEAELVARLPLASKRSRGRGRTAG